MTIDTKEALKPAKLARPMEKVNNDTAELNALVGLLNTSAKIPKEELDKYSPLDGLSGVPSAAEQAAQSNATAPRSAAVVVSDEPAAPENTAKIFFTGRVKSGKDFVAEKCGARIVGFADPMYAVAEYFFGVKVNANEGKDLPGMRAFLQTLGQWGRGQVDVNHPYTPARATFVQMIRSLGAAGTPGFDATVDWKDYGLSPDLWVDSCIRRIEDEPAPRVAITNCRFLNEYKALQAAGFQPWHVLVGGNTLQKRWQAAKLTPEALNNISEKMAAGMDANIIKEISARKNGPKLHALWSDPDAPCPSSRLYTVAQFLELMKSPPISVPTQSDEF